MHGRRHEHHAETDEGRRHAGQRDVAAIGRGEAPVGVEQAVLAGPCPVDPASFLPVASGAGDLGERGSAPLSPPGTADPLGDLAVSAPLALGQCVVQGRVVLERDEATSLVNLASQSPDLVGVGDAFLDRVD